MTSICGWHDEERNENGRSFDHGSRPMSLTNRARGFPIWLFSISIKSASRNGGKVLIKMALNNCTNLYFAWKKFCIKISISRIIALISCKKLNEKLFQFALANFKCLSPLSWTLSSWMFSLCFWVFCNVLFALNRVTSNFKSCQ